MGFSGRGFKSHIYLDMTFSDFPHVELEKYSPQTTQEMERLGLLTGPPVYPADLLSLGKLLVNLLQVVKLTNTPLIP